MIRVDQAGGLPDHVAEQVRDQVSAVVDDLRFAHGIDGLKAIPGLAGTEVDDAEEISIARLTPR